MSARPQQGRRGGSTSQRGSNSQQARSGGRPAAKKAAAAPAATRAAAPAQTRPAQTRPDGSDRTRPSAANRTKPLLVADRVSRSYGGRTVLQPVSFRLAPGRCLAVVGVNGSGKTTLLRLATGRDTPTSGTVTFAGEPVAEERLDVRARVAVVLDTGSHYPDLTVREHLQFVAAAHGVPDAATWVDWALADRNLTASADQLPSALSSGQRQALSLAAALVRPRDLLVLDEPEQRLDPGARGRLVDRIAAEKKDGTAVLFATHDHVLAADVADRILVLEDGYVLHEGRATEVSAALGVPAPAKAAAGAAATAPADAE